VGLKDWISRLFRRPPKREDLVAYWDAASKHVIHIPRSELAPGCIRVRIQGIDEPVWASELKYRMGPLRHPPFGEDILAYVRRIQSTFAEHRPISVEEWEDGFRRDLNVEQEIALWIHAAGVYSAFASNERSEARRKHLYQVVIACLTATPDTVRQGVQPGPLADQDIAEIVGRFFPPRPKGP